MEEDPQIAQQYLEQVEKTAEKIISGRQEIVMLNKRKNINMQALRELKKDNASGKSKSWICTGNMFMELPKSNAILDIEKEQKQISVELETIHKNLHEQLNFLNELEGKEATIGSRLVSLSRQEMDALKQGSH